MDITDEVALLAERLNVARLQLRRAGLWPDTDPVPLGFLIVGPDDLEGVSEFQGCVVWRVEHWPGQPVLVVPAGWDVASAYQAARAMEQYGVDAGRLRAFGPPGWEHVSIPLARGPRQSRVDFVPVTRMTMPMIGVELT